MEFIFSCSMCYLTPSLEEKLIISVRPCTLHVKNPAQSQLRDRENIINIILMAKIYITEE